MFPYKALTTRKGHAASVRRQSRQRLRSERRYRRNRFVRFYRQSVRTASAFPRLHPKGTSSRFALRAPRRFAPRNDKPLAFTVLSIACTGRQHCAGPGCPLPYNGPHKNHRLPKKQPVYRQHRTIQREHSARDFLSRQGLKSADVLCVPARGMPHP